MKRPSAWLAFAALATAWWLAIYLPCAGSGFLKDDFVWIAQSRVHSVSGLVALFSKNVGFYRPLVAVSFALDDALFGLHALPFGLTNLVLAMLVAVSIARLALSLRLTPLAAVVAAAVWALNPHGISVAVLWTSGRTALFLTLFATLAATSWAKAHPLRAAAWTLAALLSKEEAVVLPFVLLAWTLMDRRQAGSAEPRWHRLWAAVPLFAALGLYLGLRFRSGAMTPASAPHYYRFLTDWRLIAINVFEYLDRAATFPMFVAGVVMLAARRLPTLDSDARRVAAMSMVWFLAGYALTVWIPSRSSLYACFPSIGTALITGAVVAAVVRSEATIRLAPTLAVICLVAVASTPIYWLRNQRFVGPGRISTAVVAELPRLVANQPSGVILVIRDGDNPGYNLKAAFGALLPEAITLVTGRSDVAVWIDPPPGDWALAGCRRPQPGDKIASFTFDGLRLQPGF